MGSTSRANGGTTFAPSRPVEVMGSDSSTTSPANGTDVLLDSFVCGERGGKLRTQLSTRFPECSAEQIEEAVQYACKAFLDEAEDVSAPGKVYAWIRTAAFRYLNREADRHRRELAVDPIQDEIATFAADEPGPAEELIALEDDADLTMLVDKVSSSLSDRRRDVLALYGAGYKRPQIADRLGLSEATALALGKNLVKARRRAGLSQEKLATRCLLHRTEIGYIENGRRIPRVDTMLRIAGALEVKTDVLLAGIEWLPPPPSPPPVGFVCFPGAPEGQALNQRPSLRWPRPVLLQQVGIAAAQDQAQDDRDQDGVVQLAGDGDEVRDQVEGQRQVEKEQDDR